jgi:hypothetical protein
MVHRSQLMQNTKREHLIWRYRRNVQWRDMNVSRFAKKKSPCIALQGDFETNMHLASSGRLPANGKGEAGSGVSKLNVQFIVVMFVSVSHRPGNQT